MENMSLYKLDQTIKEIIENGFTFDEETGEVLFTTDDIEKLETSVDEKINNIIGFIKDLTMQQKALKEISDEYKKRFESKKKKAERLKAYLDEFLKRNMIDKKEVENGSVSYKKSTSTNIFDESILLDYLKADEDLFNKYANTKIEFSKTEIAKDLKNEIKIPGVELITKENLQIR